MSKPFTHVHSSSRYDRSPASLGLAARNYNSMADLVTYTEIQSRSRRAALRAAGGDQFGMVAGTETYSDDCAIVWNKQRFSLIFHESFKSTEIRYWNAKGNKRNPQYATNVVLEDELTGKTIVVTVIHLPSNVQALIGSKRTTQRTIAWYASFRGAKARSNKLRRKYKANAVLFIADFNMDFKLAWVRKLIKALAPAYNVTWTNLNFVGGTHHNSVIDGTLTRGKVKGHATLLEDDPSSDHRPYKDVIVVA